MDVLDVRLEPSDGVRQQAVFVTSRGDVACHYYPADEKRAADSRAGVVWLGGALGGFRSPAHDLYPRLAADLARRGVASLHVAFRHSTRLPEATLDALLGTTFLRQEGLDRLAVVGHSFGGAVAVNAAAATPSVRALVCLACQSAGVAAAASLGPRCATLLLHGADDELLPPACSHYVHRLLRGPRQLRLLPGVRHNLDEAAEDVHRHTSDFLGRHLLAAPKSPRILRLGAFLSSRL